MADPFPPDRGLQLRMVVALLTAAALAVAALAVVVWLAVAAEWWLALVVVGFAVGGLVAGLAGHRASARDGAWVMTVVAGPPSADLEMLNFLPAASGRAAGIWATHPPLARRLAQLDRMERELQEDR